MTATGWAIREHGHILPNTVQDTRRGAIVNYLVVKARILVLAHWTDEFIERLWTSYRGLYAEAIEVKIEAAK